MPNSPTILFLRAATMVTMLAVILTIAIFWNGLPPLKSGENLLPVSWKHFFHRDQEEEKPALKPRQEILAPSKQSGVHEFYEKEWNLPTRAVSLDDETSLPYFDVPTGTSNAPEPNPVFDRRNDETTISDADLPEDFTVLKRALEREYGATEILLEPWGSEGKLYRFSCYVSQPGGSTGSASTGSASTGSASSVKKFHHAIQPTPTLAIQKVMESIR